MLAPNIPKIIGWINQEELVEKVSPMMFKVGREVLDLLPSQHFVRTVRLSPKARKVYDELSKDFYAAVDTGEVTAANALVKILRLAQVTSGYLTMDDGADTVLDTSKREALEQALDEIDRCEKVVVFCRFRHDLAVVREVSEGMGRRYGEISGDRNDLVASKFPPDTDVLGAQIQSGGVGIDLSAAAYCVYFSMGLSLGDYSQSLARTDRPGQTRSVTYIHLISAGTVDEKIYAALRAHEDVVSYIVRGGTGASFPELDHESTTRVPASHTQWPSHLG
jgi:SNF2 family DNA or RNA helicase